MLFITGPIASGKTATAVECAEILEEREVRYACVDMDWLSGYSPRPESDPFGTYVGRKNLALMWGNFAAAGAERLIIAGIISSRAEIPEYEALIPGGKVTVCRLRAPIDVLHERVREREKGAGLQWHLDRSIVHYHEFERGGVEDFVVETANRPLRDVALSVLQGAGWI
jgi:hypothetical protein